VPNPPDATATVQVLAPTAVELTGLYAVLGQQGVTLGWQTVSEAEVVGFNVLRLDLEDPDADWVTLNPALIEAQLPGQVLGATYSFVDSAADPKQRYRYVLEIFDTEGNTAWRELGQIGTSLLYLPMIGR